ncbi:MAG: aromatic amino acid lyase [Streptosporangiaceae bacterium]
MTVVANGRADFTLENFRKVAFAGEGVEIGPVARAAMAAARRGFVSLLESDRTAFIYGVTRRPGIEVSVHVPPELQRAFARSFLRHSGQGFGVGWHDEQVVRGIVFARLADFVEGHAKVRPETAERVAAMLGAPMPALPLGGQAGPGEVLPMLHLVQGLGDLDLEEGEGMALINGSPYATAVLADAAVRARNRLAHTELLLALSIDAFRAPLEAYEEPLEDLWGDQHQTDALRSVRGYLTGAETADRLAHQAPVSFRIVPRLLGEARRVVAEAERSAAASLRSVTLNPVYFPPEAGHPLGHFASNGGFHNATVCPVLQSLSSSWAELALAAERQIASFHRGAAYGLPHLLNPPGYDGALSGATTLFGWVVTSYVEAARAAAAPALMPAVVVDPQNDLSTATSNAHQKERDAAGAFDGALAILALTASQALFVTGRRPAPPLRDLATGIRSVFPPVERPDGRDLGAEAGQLAGAFQAASVSGRLDFP